MFFLDAVAIVSPVFKTFFKTFSCYWSHPFLAWSHVLKLLTQSALSPLSPPSPVSHPPASGACSLKETFVRHLSLTSPPIYVGSSGICKVAAILFNFCGIHKTIFHHCSMSNAHSYVGRGCVALWSWLQARDQGVPQKNTGTLYTTFRFLVDLKEDLTPRFPRIFGTKNPKAQNPATKSRNSAG